MEKNSVSILKKLKGLIFLGFFCGGAQTAAMIIALYETMGMVLGRPDNISLLILEMLIAAAICHFLNAYLFSLIKDLYESLYYREKE